MCSILFVFMWVLLNYIIVVSFSTHCYWVCCILRIVQEYLLCLFISIYEKLNIFSLAYMAIITCFLLHFGELFWLFRQLRMTKNVFWKKEKNVLTLLFSIILIYIYFSVMEYVTDIINLHILYINIYYISVHKTCLSGFKFLNFSHVW